MFNMNLLQGNSVGDVSLDAIAVMAQAQAESGGGGCTATATCFGVTGKEIGSVSCSGTNTSVAGYGYVTCDGKTSYCA